MESLVTYNIFLTLSYVTLQLFELHVSNCAHIFSYHSIFNYGHIVSNSLNYTAHIVYSPLNSYAYIHWILDFKYILLLLFSLDGLK